MAVFSEQSKAKLATCVMPLQDLFNEVIKYFDCRIDCGIRGEKSQNEAFANGWSKVQWPNSKHNKRPFSEAVDAVPYPYDTKDEKRFYYFAGVVKGIALKMNINIRWGGDWDSDTQTNDQTFNDLGHFEVIK